MEYENKSHSLQYNVIFSKLVRHAAWLNFSYLGIIRIILVLVIVTKISLARSSLIANSYSQLAVIGS